jgi:hypothetical protein
VRRALAIALMLLFSLPLVSSLTGAEEAEMTLPLCCRRNGQHHCDMPSEKINEKSGASAVKEKCPYGPPTAAVVLPPLFTPSAAAAIFAGIVHHPATSPQTDAWFRVSFDRSRQKRGPPNPLA